MKAPWQMSSSEEFTLEFNGIAVENGEMDITDLAPSLLAFSRLCTEANQTLNGERAAVSVRVRADLKRGSFGIDIHLIQNTIEQIRSLLGTTQIKDLKSILDTLGVLGDDVIKIGGGLGVLGLIGIAKRIGHGKPSLIEKDEAATRVVYNNATLFVDSGAWEMYQRADVRNDLETLTNPLRRDGIEELRFKKGQRKTNQIRRDDLSGFTVNLPEGTEITPDEGDVLSDDIQPRTWQVRQITFDPDLKTWRFWEGKAHIRAAMLDADFVKSVDRGEKIIRGGDFLRVEARVIVRRTKDGESNPSYEIVKVRGVISQPKLPLKTQVSTEETQRHNETPPTISEYE